MSSAVRASARSLSKRCTKASKSSRAFWSLTSSQVAQPQPQPNGRLKTRKRLGTAMDKGSPEHLSQGARHGPVSTKRPPHPPPPWHKPPQSGKPFESRMIHRDPRARRQGAREARRKECKGGNGGKGGEGRQVTESADKRARGTWDKGAEGHGDKQTSGEEGQGGEKGRAHQADYTG